MAIEDYRAELEEHCESVNDANTHNADFTVKTKCTLPELQRKSDLLIREVDSVPPGEEGYSNIAIKILGP